MHRRKFISTCAAAASAWATTDRFHGAAFALDENPTATEVAAKPKRKVPYLLGADVSWVTEDESQGATYWDRGVQKDLFDILKSYGFNATRENRLFGPPHFTRTYTLPVADAKKVHFARQIPG